MGVRDQWHAGNGSRRLLIATLLFYLSLAVLGGAFLVAWQLRPDAPWDPLGDYPLQRVVDKTVRLDEPVQTVGTKCADESVTVTGSLRWQSIDPPGTVLFISSGSAVRQEGCHEFRFANPIPAAVLALIEQQGGPLHWIISGTETPIREGQTGVPRSWQTEPFELIP